MADVKLIIGGSLEDDTAAFLDAWHHAERGETVKQRVLAFESWEGLAQVMIGERYRLLRHLHQHQHPEPSVSVLARGRSVVSIAASTRMLLSWGRPD
jgi:predicted transcriptional regulator